MKISDILEEAAQRFENGTNETRYSCVEIEYIREQEYPQYYSLVTDHPYYDVLFDGLEEMGLDLYSTSVFLNVPEDQRAQARSLWLTWAAMMAREQGL